MAVMVEQRPFRPFKSSEEYLWAMKEDLADWLNKLYPNLYISAEIFWERLDNGVVLCRHTDNVRDYAQKYVSLKEETGKTYSREAYDILKHPPVKCFSVAKRETFFARDNVSNFITWCRKALKIIECLLFESDDLILLKNEKNVILCLLELARRGSRLGMPAPTLVMMEKEIDNELARDVDEGVESGDDLALEMIEDVAAPEVIPDVAAPEVIPAAVPEPIPEVIADVAVPEVIPAAVPEPIPEVIQEQIVTNDLRKLHDIVRQELETCKCPTQFPMIRVSEGKYRIGNSKVLIFVRLLRNHVMVRVGGGWDTLAHYLDKHDPCRCKTAHRQTTGAKLSGVRPATPNRPNMEISKATIKYERC